MQNYTQTKAADLVKEDTYIVPDKGGDPISVEDREEVNRVGVGPEMGRPKFLVVGPNKTVDEEEGSGYGVG